MPLLTRLLHGQHIREEEIGANQSHSTCNHATIDSGHLNGTVFINYPAVDLHLECCSELNHFSDLCSSS